MVSRLLRKPYIYWDEQWIWPITVQRFLIWPFLKSLVKNASAIIVPGTKSEKFYASIIPRCRGKIFVAPNVSLLSKNSCYEKRTEELRAKLQLADRKVILFFGRLVKLKGVTYLIKAFARVRKKRGNVSLLIVGDPIGEGSKYDLDSLRSYCQVLGIKADVLFHSSVYGPEKTPYFLLADILVLPSVFHKGGSEVWGFVVNEAMSVGKPVIVTRAVGAAYDLIKDGINGFIVREGDSEDLCKAISHILDDPQIERRMGINSEKIIFDGYTYSHMFCGFRRAIKHALTYPSKRQFAQTSR
jgi:glycosyltransferase involved in cell wall biosynthesis